MEHGLAVQSTSVHWLGESVSFWCERTSLESAASTASCLHLLLHLALGLLPHAVMNFVVGSAVSRG